MANGISAAVFVNSVYSEFSTALLNYGFDPDELSYTFETKGESVEADDLYNAILRDLKQWIRSQNSPLSIQLLNNYFDEATIKASDGIDTVLVRELEVE